jgi:hypothetical protein
MGKNVAVMLTMVSIAALAVALPRPAFSQPQLNGPKKQDPTPMQTPSQEYAGATSYFDYPLWRLKEAVPALRGLNYDASQDASQDRLPSILAGMSHTIADLLLKLPDLASREEIYHFQSKRDPSASGGESSLQPWSREFNYLLLCRHYADGSTKIEESRTDGKGHPVKPSRLFTSPRSYGFAYQWLLFSAANQPEFNFRYLGQQEKEGRKTYVVAFAQIPNKVTDPAYFESLGKSAPFFYQGVVWVDQSSFDIVMLRTDLLAPLPDLQLRQLTTELHFRSAPIRGYNAAFWLPSEVHVSSDQGLGPAEESHRYSNYHLFHSEARIVLSP